MFSAKENQVCDGGTPGKHLDLNEFLLLKRRTVQETVYNLRRELRLRSCGHKAPKLHQPQPTSAMNGVEHEWRRTCVDPHVVLVAKQKSLERSSHEIRRSDS